jgi:hypothetical protein
LPFAQARLDLNPPTYSSLHSWDDRHLLRPGIGWDGIYCLVWSQSVILPVSTSCVGKDCRCEPLCPAVCQLLLVSIQTC